MNSTIRIGARRVRSGDAGRRPARAARGLLAAAASASQTWLVPLLIVVLWQAASAGGLVPGSVLPSPGAILRTAWETTLTGELPANMQTTLWRALAGFAVGDGIGFALGLSNGLSGALDALTRLEMQALIAKSWADDGFTAVLVTHDVSEAVRLADRIIVIEGGGLTLDIPNPGPHPRSTTSAASVELEDIILRRLMRAS